MNVDAIFSAKLRQMAAQLERAGEEDGGGMVDPRLAALMNRAARASGKPLAGPDGIAALMAKGVRGVIADLDGETAESDGQRSSN